MKLTLCGSARFEQQFKDWNKNLTLLGHTVYSLACYPSDFGGKNWYTDAEKIRLDEAHREKIDNSEGIFIINVDDYIGDSTRGEIEHARKDYKLIIWAYPSKHARRTDNIWPHIQ